MSEKVTVRLFFAPSCGGGCSCSCGPNKDMAAFEQVAEELAGKFGEERLVFEAYPASSTAKFPFLKKAEGANGKIALPFVSVDETVMTPGKVPASSDIEKEIANRLKVA